MSRIGVANYYPTGIKITDKQLAAVPITKHDFHGDWNYTIVPPTATAGPSVPR